MADERPQVQATVCPTCCEVCGRCGQHHERFIETFAAVDECGLPLPSARIMRTVDWAPCPPAALRGVIAREEGR